jgi:hypothetical protein
MFNLDQNERNAKRENLFDKNDFYEKRKLNNQLNLRSKKIRKRDREDKNLDDLSVESNVCLFYYCFYFILELFLIYFRFIHSYCFFKLYILIYIYLFIFL